MGPHFKLAMPPKALRRVPLAKHKRAASSGTLSEAVLEEIKEQGRDIWVAICPFYRGERLDGDYYKWLLDYYDGDMPPLIRRINQFREFPQMDNPHYNQDDWRAWKDYYDSPEFQDEFAPYRVRINVYLSKCGSSHKDVRKGGHNELGDRSLGKYAKFKHLDLARPEDVETPSFPPLPPLSPLPEDDDDFEDYHEDECWIYGHCICDEEEEEETQGKEEEQAPATPKNGGVRQYNSPAGLLMVPQNIPKSRDLGRMQVRSNVDVLATLMDVYATSPLGPPYKASPAYEPTTPLGSSYSHIDGPSSLSLNDGPADMEYYTHSLESIHSSPAAAVDGGDPADSPQGLGLTPKSPTRTDTTPQLPAQHHNVSETPTTPCPDGEAFATPSSIVGQTSAYANIQSNNGEWKTCEDEGDIDVSNTDVGAAGDKTSPVPKKRKREELDSDSDFNPVDCDSSDDSPIKSRVKRRSQRTGRGGRC